MASPHRPQARARWAASVAGGGHAVCGQAKVGKPKAKQGRAIVAAKIKQPALFFSCLRVLQHGPRMVAFPDLRLRMQLLTQNAKIL